jgi:hypothetical protein
VAEDLVSTAAFMTGRGLLHFDAHVGNVLADGERLYVSDFGLALSSTWSTTRTRTGFLREHDDHDIAYVVRELVNWLVAAFADDSKTWTDATQRNELVRSFAEGRTPLRLPDRGCRARHPLRARRGRHERLLLPAAPHEPTERLPGP